MPLKNVEIILPITLVILRFILKLYIDKSGKVLLMIKSLYELPVDIIFLALSFVAVFTISSEENAREGVLYCFVFIVLILISNILWRNSITRLETKGNEGNKGNKNIIFSAFIFIINACGASFCLVYSFSLFLR